MQQIAEFLSQFDGFKVLLAVIITIAGLVFIGVTGIYVDKYLENHLMKMSKSAKLILGRIVSGTIGLTVMTLIFKIAGIGWTGSIIMMVFVITIVSGATKNLTDNIAYGLVLAGNKYYKIGDFIKSGEYEGTVRKISFFDTEIQLLNGKTIHMPSATIAAQKLSVIKPNDEYVAVEKVLMGNRHSGVKVIADIEKVILNTPGILKDNAFGDRDCIVHISAEENYSTEYVCIFKCRFKDRYDVIGAFYEGIHQMKIDNNYFVTRHSEMH